MSDFISRAVCGKESFLCLIYGVPLLAHWKFRRSLGKLDPTVISWITAAAFLGIGVYLYIRGREVERRDALMLFDPKSCSFETFCAPDHFLGATVKQWSYLSVPLAISMLLRT